jgi:hypothetical protein
LVLRRRGRSRLATLGAATLAASVAVALSPATAVAVDQTPKNGCTSPTSYSGALTSPVFDTPSEVAQQPPPAVRLQGWLEAEGVNPSGFDQATIEYSLDGTTWVPFGNLNDEPDTGGSPDTGHSNNGTGTAPSFQPYTFAFPAEAQGQTGVQIRFVFDTGDSSYNGFRGAAVDQISIDTTSAPRTENFEDGATGWTFDAPSESGPNVPFWHIVNNPQNISVKSPEINPDLVTLPDSGALPAAAEGSHVAWFGDDATGTFCGPDYANRQPPPDEQPPETTITGGPPATTNSTSADFTFQSSEEGSSFECQLDDGGFAPCESPQSYSGLPPGQHTFQVQATDAAFNTDPTPAAHSWTVDTAAPETTITGGPPASTTSTDAAFSFQSSEAGSSFECRLDGGAFAPCSSPHSYSGLTLGSHTFEVRATDPAGNLDSTSATHGWTVIAQTPPRPRTLDELPNPELGEVVNVQELSGQVLVGIPAGLARSAGRTRASQKGVRFVALSEAQQIPVGSYLDTRKGTVRLQTARDRKGTRQNGDFSKGLFQVKQSSKTRDRGLTTAVLKGGNFRNCGKRRGKRATAAASIRRRLRSRTRGGNYRTRARGSAGTARGTNWDTFDRCDGTLTRVREGKVSVRDFRRRKTVVVRAGRSYLARVRR